MRYAVDVTVEGVEIDTVGLILMVVGIIGLVISLAIVFMGSGDPPRRPDEMSRVDEREDVLASPLLARSLLTVRAAISLARFVDLPCCLALSLMCSYWRSRLSLQAF